jgi:tetrahydromethanopterin S-methyltransferase subunit F
MEISPAFLTFLGAIIGAMIGAMLAPFVQWQIEKRRHQLAYRKELIATWRKLFEGFNDSKISGLPDEEILYMLMK